MSKPITIQTTVNAPVAKAWDYYNQPEHVKAWNSASADWHTVAAQNDLRVGGSFSYRMEAKDGSEGFDFEGKYDAVEPHSLMSYTMDDGRKVKVTFKSTGETTVVEVTFDPETENSPELQRSGWQAILDNFRMYAEQN